MTTLKSIALILFLFVSCNQKDESKRIVYNRKDSTRKFETKTVFNFDTTFFKKVKGGFYTNSSGDIYELKVTVGEDSLGFYNTYFLDSLMFFGDYPSKKPLKYILDLGSYENDSLSNFSKDKKHVYYIQGLSDGHIRHIVDKADPKTFFDIKDRWGKDNQHIYYETEIIKEADLKTFEVYKTSNDTAKDKNHLYYRGAPLR